MAINKKTFFQLSPFEQYNSGFGAGFKCNLCRLVEFSKKIFVGDINIHIVFYVDARK